MVFGVRNPTESFCKFIEDFGTAFTARGKTHFSS